MEITHYHSFIPCCTLFIFIIVNTNNRPDITLTLLEPKSFSQETASFSVTITGYHTKPCRIKRINEQTIKITLTEGKNRQIRRMAKALKYQVIDLLRIRIGHIELNDIPEGGYRKLTEEKVLKFN